MIYALSLLFGFISYDELKGPITNLAVTSLETFNKLDRMSYM